MKTLTNSQTTLTKKLSAAYALTNIPLPYPVISVLFLLV